MASNFVNPRLKFPIGKQQQFIYEVLKNANVPLVNIASTANVSSRTIRDWRNEKYHITELAVRKLCNKYNISVPTNLEEMRLSWQRNKSEICRIGGIARYRIYGNFGTPEGRRKGGHKTLEILRKRGLAAWCARPYIYPKKSVKLAEFVGIMLGDGGVTKEQATITLNTEADKDYIKYVFKLCSSLFGQEPKIAPRNDCKATNIRYSGINLIKYLQKIGLKHGDKVKQQVGVPLWISKSTKYKIACLRGLMDTDGCIARCTHKCKSKVYRYLNPCFANRSKPILNFVKNTLKELNLGPSIAGERIWLYNKHSVREYFKIVGSSNYRLLRFRNGEWAGR